MYPKATTQVALHHKVGNCKSVKWLITWTRMDSPTGLVRGHPCSFVGPPRVAIMDYNKRNVVVPCYEKEEEDDDEGEYEARAASIVSDGRLGAVRSSFVLSVDDQGSKVVELCLLCHIPNISFQFGDSVCMYSIIPRLRPTILHPLSPRLLLCVPRIITDRLACAAREWRIGEGDYK